MRADHPLLQLGVPLELRLPGEHPRAVLRGSGEHQAPQGKGLRLLGGPAPSGLAERIGDNGTWSAPRRWHTTVGIVLGADGSPGPDTGPSGARRQPHRASRATAARAQEASCSRVAHLPTAWCGRPWVLRPVVQREPPSLQGATHPCGSPLHVGATQSRGMKVSPQAGAPGFVQTHRKPGVWKPWQEQALTNYNLPSLLTIALELSGGEGSQEEDSGCFGRSQLSGRQERSTDGLASVAQGHHLQQNWNH